MYFSSNLHLCHKIKTLILFALQSSNIDAFPHSVLLYMILAHAILRSKFKCHRSAIINYTLNCRSHTHKYLSTTYQLIIIANDHLIDRIHKSLNTNIAVSWWEHLLVLECWKTFHDAAPWLTLRTWAHLICLQYTKVKIQITLCSDIITQCEEYEVNSLTMTLQLSSLNQWNKRNIKIDTQIIYFIFHKQNNILWTYCILSCIKFGLTVWLYKVQLFNIWLD